MAQAPGPQGNPGPATAESSNKHPESDATLTTEAADKLDKFFDSLAGAASPLLLLDYDGTLAAFRVDRFQSRPWSGVAELLSEIQRRGRTRISVISGRPPQEIAEILALDAPFEVWGLHGAERLYPDGRRELEEMPPATRAKLDELREHLRRDAFGGLLEEKSNAVVMHWRGHAPRKAGFIEHHTRRLFEPLAQMEGLALLKFEAGLELRAGSDKGAAVRSIMREAVPGAPVTYLGDDFTDEAAFHAVNEAQGPHLSVLMSRKWRKTAADLWLRPPADLRMFLKRWLGALDGGTAHMPAGRTRGKTPAKRG